jgi:hypothetical protein
MSPLRRASLLGLLAIAALSSASSGCKLSHAESGEVPAGGGAAAAPSGVSAAAAGDVEGDRCRARVKEIEALPALPGAPGFEANRVAILGRARGEPMVFTRAPQAADPASLSADARRSLEVFAKERRGARVTALVKRFKQDKATLRALLLREGYAYAEDPLDALALAADVKLVDLFDEPSIYLQRGARVHKLARVEDKAGKEKRYVFEDGPFAGMAADLLFGDRVALSQDQLAAPLHRDLAALADEAGFDRATVVRATDKAMLADLRFGERRARAVLDTEGAAVRLACLAEDAEARAAVDAYRKARAPKLRALGVIRDAVTALVSEAMRFDRPLNEKSPDKDGQMRPVWMTAYLQGRASYSFEGNGYPVYDAQGRAWPPEVCVDFVLDSFERGTGTWFRPKGEAPARAVGRFTWIDDMREQRGVIGFGQHAEKHPELFEVRRFAGAERIPFGERERFFKFLADHADEIHAGDVVAIHGEKRDNRIHQHAILVERTDPITGFAFGLADQMRHPRRRTWEGIMAEAPKRSLLFRVHPKDSIFAAIDPGEPIAAR